MEFCKKDFFELGSKVAFIPGGYGDLGKAIAYGLSESGVKVVVAGRSLEKGQGVADEIKERGGEASALALDVESVAEIHKVADAVVDLYGGIDFLVNCIGIQREQQILDVTEEAYDLVYRTNLKSAMFLAQATSNQQCFWPRQPQSTRSRQEREVSTFTCFQSDLCLDCVQRAILPIAVLRADLLC